METLILLSLILLNGVFAMSEMAVVSSRKTRLQQWADEGSPQAQAALDLANEPGPFLSTVQVGITLAGFLAFLAAAIVLGGEVYRGWIGGGDAKVAIVSILTGLHADDARRRLDGDHATQRPNSKGQRNREDADVRANVEDDGTRPGMGADQPVSAFRSIIELHVADDDMGKVIGRNGSVAKALRTLLKVTAARDGEPVQLEIV